MSDGSPRRVIARVALILFGLTLLWGASLMLLGGIDAKVLGLSISSHEPMRPFLIAALALAAFMLTGGDTPVIRWSSAFEAAIARSDRAAHFAAGAIAAAVVAAGIVEGSNGACGSDSYGYVSQAELWLHHDLSVPQPWAREVPWPDALRTFTPLGYIPAPPGTRDPWSIVPTYAPGLPMLMAAAKAIAGNAAMYFVVPLTGGLLVLATYGIGRRLGSTTIGLIAAFLLATSNAFLENVVAPMTDVPVAAGWALVWWGALGRSVRSAWAAALAAAIAIVVRPERVPLALAVVAWLAWCVWTDRADRRRHLQRAAVVLAGMGAGALTVAIILWRMYGSPFESGYGAVSSNFALTYFLPNLGAYAGVLAGAETPIALVGIAALLIPSRRVWPTASDRGAVVVLAVFAFLVWAEYCLVPSHNAWGRFLLPSYPPILIGLAAVWLAAADAVSGGRRLVTVVTVLLFGLAGVRNARERNLFNAEWNEARCIGVAEHVARSTPPNSVVLSMQHSGSLRYYAGRMTLRWDQLPADGLDSALAWLSSRGIHTYAVLESWELPRLEQYFAGQASVEKFSSPAFSWQDITVYDLERAPGSSHAIVMPAPPRYRFGRAPAPPPTLALTPR